MFSDERPGERGPVYNISLGTLLSMQPLPPSFCRKSISRVPTRFSEAAKRCWIGNTGSSLSRCYVFWAAQPARLCLSELAATNQVQEVMKRHLRVSKNPEVTANGLCFGGVWYNVGPGTRERSSVGLAEATCRRSLGRQLRPAIRISGRRSIANALARYLDTRLPSPPRLTEGSFRSELNTSSLRRVGLIARFGFSVRWL